MAGARYVVREVHAAVDGWQVWDTLKAKFVTPVFLVKSAAETQRRKLEAGK